MKGTVRLGILMMVGLAGLLVAAGCTSTTTTLGASHLSLAFGSPDTFTATVSSGGSTHPPGGTVSFTVDGAATPQATVPIDSNGVATLTTAGLSAGPHTVVARYNGFLDYGGYDVFEPSTSNTVNVTVTTTSTVTGSHPGALIVGPGMQVLVSSATVGSVIVQSGGAVDIENSTVSSITASGPSALRVCNTTITGSLNVSRANGFVLIGDSGDDGCIPNTIGGTLSLTSNTGGVEAINNQVGGAVISSGDSGTGAYPEDTGPEVTGNGPSPCPHTAPMAVC